MAHRGERGSDGGKQGPIAEEKPNRQDQPYAEHRRLENRPQNVLPGDPA